LSRKVFNLATGKHIDGTTYRIESKRSTVNGKVFSTTCSDFAIK
jgi:hypothetical protein